MSDHGWIVPQADEGTPARFEELEPPAAVDSPDEEVDTLLQVEWSSLNYKDALALHGRPGVVRRTPLVAGIDAVGRVLETSDGSGLGVGDRVVVTGAGLGESLDGGFASRTCVPSRDAVPIPPEFTGRQSAAVGTAGFTAALALLALADHGVGPDDGPALVTGAAGGLGSISIALLAGLGYEVTAATGRVEEQHERLSALGAAHVIARDDLLSARPLGPRRWGCGIDALGGMHLAGVLAGLREGGAVAACGVTSGSELPTTVMPFVLRGVALLGVSSVSVARCRRARAWDLLARVLDRAVIDGLTRVVRLEDAHDVAAEMLQGRGTGRVVVRIDPAAPD